MKKRNKTQSKHYLQVEKKLNMLKSQFSINKNGKELDRATISKDDADKALISSGEMVAGLEVSVK